MHLLSWEEGAIRLRGVLAKTSCNKGLPWDPESNETLLRKVSDP